MPKCDCGEPVEEKCVQCKKQVCGTCGMETVVGFLCGEYTQWGCARKYTNCDECANDIAIHEGDLIICEECSKASCKDCAEGKVCAKCEVYMCVSCEEEHTCK